MFAVSDGGTRDTPQANRTATTNEAAHAMTSRSDFVLDFRSAFTVVKSQVEVHALTPSRTPHVSQGGAARAAVPRTVPLFSASVTRGSSSQRPGEERISSSPSPKTAAKCFSRSSISPRASSCASPSLSTMAATAPTGWWRPWDEVRVVSGAALF